MLSTINQDKHIINNEKGDAKLMFLTQSPVFAYSFFLSNDELAKIWILHTKNWVGHEQLSEYHRGPYSEKINPILGPLNNGEYVSFPTKEEFRAYLRRTFSLKGLVGMKERSERINSEGWNKYSENLKTWWVHGTQPSDKVMKFSEAF